MARRPFLLGFLSASAIFGLLACGGTTGPAPTPPSITRFTVSPSTVTTGGSATLAAVFANGSGSIDQGIGAVPSGVGVSTGALSSTRTYTLSVTGSGITATAQVTVSVAAPPAEVTAVYMGNPLPTAGQSVLLLAEKAWTPFPFAPYVGAPLPARVERIHRVGYSESFRVPLWTSYRSFKKEPYTALPDRQDFLQDPDSTAAVKHADFTNSGYTRGHMVPRADIGYRYSADAQAGTFILTNICPQLEAHNSGIWQQLESIISGSLSGSIWTPGLADTFNQIWVVTGPVVEANPARLPSQIAIPSAFYKIVVRERSPGDPVALAILTPHEDLDTAAMPDYITSVRRIEQVTGLNFFPDLPSATQETFENAVDVRGWGAPFERTGSAVQAAMVEPSWDLTVTAGTTVNFKGAAVTSTAGGSIATQTWNFGDGSTGSGATATHAYLNSTPLAVTLTASYTATDSTAATRTVSRQIKVLSSNPANTPPTISTVANQVLAKNTAMAATAFTVGDTETAATALGVTASSSNTTLIPSAALVLGGSGSTRTIAATPATDQSGIAQIALTVTDGGGLTASSVFQIQVTSSSASPGKVIISQYYEGANNDKWIELTNVGGQSADFASPQIHLALFNNAAADAPSGLVPNSTYTLGGTLAPGASLLFKNSSAALPAYAVGTATGVCLFNEDDLVILTTSIDTSAWANRIDVVGDGTFWGKDTSFYRAPGILQPNATWTPSEWIPKTLTQVNEAGVGTSERLGVHIFTLPTFANAETDKPAKAAD
jgi:endonuclease G